MKLRDFRRCPVCGTTSTGRYCFTCALVAGLALTVATIEHVRHLIEFACRTPPFFQWIP